MNINQDCFDNNRNACSSKCNDWNGNTRGAHICESKRHTDDPQCSRVAKNNVRFPGKPNIVALCDFHTPKITKIQLRWPNGGSFSVEQQMLGPQLKAIRGYLSQVLPDVPYDMIYGKNIMTFYTTPYYKQQLQQKAEEWVYNLHQ